jgi:asparagine synthase (glutamine-hydrolysing)
MATRLLFTSVVCGIAGIASTNGDRIDADRLADMIAMLAHRGPDGRGLHVDGSVGLAHARLSIVDLAGGQQPMSNEDGSIWITFNGEIFNHVELRAELTRKGHQFRTRSDTEVILHLYEEEGADAVRRLNGQWAFGLWDARRRLLFLSRDRIGVRPLFYSVSARRLLFASEIKALFADPGVSRALDPRGLDNIFTSGRRCHRERCFATCASCRRATRCSGATANVSRQRIGSRRSLRPTTRGPESDWIEELDARLTCATRLRLRADVPVGALLSGGPRLVADYDTGGTRECLAPADVLDRLRLIRNSTRACTSGVSPARSTSIIASCAAPTTTSFGSFPTSCGMPKRRSCAPPRRRCSSSLDACATPATRWCSPGEGADEIFGGYAIFKEAKLRRFWSRNPASRLRPLLLTRLYPFMPELQRQPPAFREGSSTSSPMT